ncbi:Alstrom syndrome protein 1, partial [Galemys pyrenaicus]
KRESWNCLPQEMDSSQTLTTPQTRFNVREEETDVTHFPSLEEGVLTQSENHVKEPNRDLLCSPLLVIQDNFASPDLPLLTCLTRDQDLGTESLFQQSELDFAPLRGIPGKSEDTEWFSRPSEVSEALFQAASKVASNLVNSCLSVSQHPQTGSTTVESQRSFLPPEQGTKEETISSETVDELKTPKDSDSYDALCSYMSWKTQEVIQESETNLADKDQVSISTSTDKSDEYITPKGSEHFDVQYWNQKALQQSEKYLTRKDHDSFSDSSDMVDKNKIPKGNDSFSAPFSYTPWSKQGTSHYPEISPVSKDYVSFPHEVPPRFNNEIPCSFFHCSLGRREKEFPLMSDSHYFKSVYLEAPADNNVKQKMDSLEGYERNEEGLGKELPQYFELKEDRNTLVFSEVHTRSSEIQYIENIVSDNSVKVSKVHDTFTIETSGGPPQTVKSSLDETSEQLYFQEERNQKATSAFGGENVDASENIAFEAVIASIEPSKKDCVVNEIQTDITKSLTNESQESESEISDLSLLSYDENFFSSKRSHQCYQSTPEVFEQAPSRPLLRKKHGDDSSLSWHPNLKSPPITSQEMFINPFSVTPELKSSLRDKTLGLGKMQSRLFQCDINNEPFLPIGKIKSISALDLAVKVGSSNIFFPVKVSTSDSLVSQDLNQQTFEEVTDSSNCILGKNINSNNITEGPPSAVRSSFSAHLVSCDVESQGALPVTSDASLIAAGQEILLKADIGQGEIPEPMGAKCSFTIHTIMQNDSYFIEGLQGKAESDICTLDDDIECCSLDENGVVCSERVAELQREISDQGDMTSECIERAGLDNVLDRDIGESSLHWKSPLKLPSKEESSFEEPVDHSNVGIKQTFSSILPSFVSHEPVRELNYHPADLRMLRVSLDTVPEITNNLTGVTSKGGITDITHSNLRPPDITTTPGVSDIESHLSLSPEEFSHLAVRSPQDNNIGQHTDSLNQQALADSHLTEETLKVSAVLEPADQKTGISTVPSSSDSQRGKPHIFYPEALTNSNLAEQAENVSADPGFSEQNTGIPTVTSTSYSYREQSNIFYRQELPDSHLSEETLKVSAASGPAGQKAGIPKVPASSYSVGEKHNIFYQQTLPGSYPTEETLKVLAVSGPGDQKTGKTTVTFSPDPNREKRIIFSQHQFPVSHLPEESPKDSASFGSADQKTGITTGSSASYLHGEKFHIFYPQGLPDSHLTEQAQRVSAAPGYTEQGPGISAVTSPYSYREKPNFFYQQELPESQLIKEAHAITGGAHQKSGIPLAPPTSYSPIGIHSNFYQHELPNSLLTEEALRVSAVPGPIDQKTGLPSEPFTYYSHRDKPVVFYEQEFPGSPLTEQAQRISAVPRSADQRTGVSTVTSTPNTQRDQPFIFYQQKLPDSNLIEGLRGSAVPGPVDHRAEIQTVQTGSSKSYLFGDKPSVSYQQTLPGSRLPEEVQKFSVALGSAENKTGLPSEPFTYYSYRDKPAAFYQQEFLDSLPTEQALKVSAAPGSADQRTGKPTVTSIPYAQREQPFIFYQQKLPGSHLTEEAQKVSALSGPTDQKTGLPSEPFASFSYTSKPVTLYQQFPETPLTEQAQKVSAVSGPTDQKAGLPSEPYTSYSHRDKPAVFHQQELPADLLAEQAQKVSAAPGSADQRTGKPTVTSVPYTQREQPFFFYQQKSPESHLTEEAQKVSGLPGPTDQKTGLPSEPYTSFSYTSKPVTVYQQFPETPLTEQAQKVSAAPGSTDQWTGKSTVTSIPHTQREQPFFFYQKNLPDGHLTEEAQKVSGLPGPTDQKTGLPSEPYTSFSYTSKPVTVYQQGLPANLLAEQSQKVSAAPGSADQRTGKSIVTSTPYSYRDQPFIFYQRELQESPLTEQAQKVLAAPGSADQRTEISTVSSSSYSLEGKPIIFYQQALTDRHLTEEAPKVLAAPGSADQRTGIPTVTSIPYTQRDQPFIFYQQKLPESHLTEEARKVSALPGPTDQKTGLPSEPFTYYSHRDKPVVFYEQEFPGSPLTEQAQRISAVPRSVDQRTGKSTVSSSSSSLEGKPIIFYPQAPDRHLTEEAPKVLAAPGSADQRTGKSIVTSTPYSYRGQPFIFYHQELQESPLHEQAQKVLAAPGSAENKTGLPSEPFTSYSYRDKPAALYLQEFLDSLPTEQALKVSATSGLADQRTAKPTVTSIPYAHRDQSFIFYQQKLPGSHLTEKAQNTSAPGPTDQKTGLPSEPFTSYSHRDQSVIFYQEFPDSPLTEQAQKVLAAPGSADQRTGITAVSSSSSLEGKPIIFYPQAPNRHLTEEAPKVSTAPGSADQTTGIPAVTSTYLHREKSTILHQQDLPDSSLTEEAHKVSPVPGTGDQRTGIPVETSVSYSHSEKPIISYQQALSGSHLTEEALKIASVSGSTDQKTRIPTELSSSYSYKEEPVVFYQQELPDVTEEALQILGGPGAVDQKTGLSAVIPSYSHREKPVVSYQQELIETNEDVLKLLGVFESVDQKTGIQIVPTIFLRETPVFSDQKDLPDITEEPLKVSGIPGPAEQQTGERIVSSPSLREGPIFSYQKDVPDITEETLKVSAAAGPTEQQTGERIVSYSLREGPIFSYQKDLPGITEETSKVSVVPGPADQKTGTRIIPSSSSSYRERAGVFYPKELPDLTEETLKVFPLPGPADQKTESSTTSSSPYLQREKPKDSTVIGPDQKTPSLAVFHDSYSQRVKPTILFQQQLTDKYKSEDTLKISTVPESTDVDSRIPVPLPSSYSHKEKSNIFFSQELPDKQLKASVTPGQAEQKTLLPATLPSSFSHKEKPNIVYQEDLPNRHLAEDSLTFSSDLGQAENIAGFSAVAPDTYSHSEKHKLVSDHVQRLIDNLDSSNSSLISNSMPLQSQADGRIVINKPESSGFENVGSADVRDMGNGSKTLKEIRTLLMEAENIALKRCNFSSPLVPFRDVGDISFIQSKKVVCFKEPPTTDNSHGDLPHKQSFTDPTNQDIQKDISTQTNLKCQRGIENWEFISSTTVRSPLEEAESKAKVTLDETLRQYKAARSVMRSEPEGYSRTIGNKIVIPMMTIIKSDSSSDASSCSWDSNSLESVSDVLLNFFPYASPKTSMTDSREEEGVSESDDAGSSVDSLAAHVKNLLKCESSLNHAKQILKNAEEEECRVRARAWNLKFNLAHEYECGYSISELNEDDRRKVEEIKAKLFGQERTALSKGLRSPQGIGCKPEAVCSHIIIESHEKGCFRTLTAEQPQLDTQPCVFRSAEPSEMIRGQRSPSSWRSRHINLCKSLDQSNPHFKVWNSLQFQSHSPFENFTSDDFKISKGLQMPFHEKMDPWLSELVDPACVLPPEEMDCHFPSRSSSQMPPPESMKKFTTSITFSSHRHSKCISDSSVFKVGVTEGSQCTGASVGVFNSHFTEEQNLHRELKQKTCSPSSFKIIGHSPDKAVTILAESSRQNQKLPAELSHQEEKLLERSHFKGSHFEPSTHANSSNFKEVHFSDNHTLISMDRPSSTLSIKEKNVTITPDFPSHIFLEQRELFEQCKFPLTDDHMGKHSPPPQHQDYVAPNIPCRIFLEKQELFEQCKTPHVDHQMRENESPFPQGQDNIAFDTPCSIFLEQRKLFEQSKAPNKDYHVRKHPPSLPQNEDSVVEKKSQHNHKSHISNMINVEPSSNNVVSQSTPNQYTLVTSPSTPPSNKKAISCVRITLGPKTPSKLDSGTLDKTVHSLDPASKTRMNSEFNSDLQTISSRSLEPASKLLASKSIAQDQESLGFLGPKSSPDFQVVQSPLPDSNTQDSKTIPFQNSQLVTSRQTQVNSSDLESNPEGTPVSADRPSEEIKMPLSAFSGKLSSDAVTQITTESPDKTLLSSEIFINDDDLVHEIPEPKTQKMLSKVPVKLASSSSIQQISVSRGTDAQPSLLPYKPSGDTKMYYVPQLSQIPPSLDSKSDTTIESSHSGSNDAIAPNFPAQVLGTRDDDLAVTVNIKHKEGIYSKRAVTKASLSVGKKPFQKDNAENDVIISDAQVQVTVTKDERLLDKNHKEEFHSKWAVTVGAQSEEKESLQKDTAGFSDAAVTGNSAQLPDTKIENLPDTKEIKQIEEVYSKRPVTKEAWSENKESLQIDIAGPGFENTTHSVFRSAKFYFHHPVHLSNDQEFSHESLGRSVFMRHSWKDFFQHHPDKQREPSYLPPPNQNAEKKKADYTKIESLSINVNLENKEAVHNQTRGFPKIDQKINDSKRDHKVTPEQTTQHTASLNELWNKYQERQKRQKPSEFSDRKELSLVERLDRLAKLLQNPITHSLQLAESTQDDSKGEQDDKEWVSKHQQQKNKLQKKKRYKNLEKCHKNTGDLKKNKVFPAHQVGRSNQIKIEQIKFDKYVLRKQPGFHYINNTSSDSRPSEESDLLTDTPTNILSPTTSVDSDILTQTDKEVTYERSSSISTIDTARLIQAFGHERVCLSPRQIKLYSSITDHQRRYLEKRSRNKRPLNIGHPQMTSEHTRRKHVQVHGYKFHLAM